MHGFWLDKNTFIMADKAKIKKAKRKSYKSYQEVEEAEMLVLTNAVEITVDSKGVIVGEDKLPNLGLWLDHVNRAIAKYEFDKKKPV